MPAICGKVSLIRRRYDGLTLRLPFYCRPPIITSIISVRKFLSEQPAISCLGNSDTKDFPLVLVFGREFNNKTENRVVNKVGTYSFSRSPHSLFWNRTYRFIERVCPCDGLKALCIKSNLSPVLFSNVLPNPIPNAQTSQEKSKRRRAASESDIRFYLEEMFKLPILDRVRFVVLSGVKDQRFYGKATDLILGEFKRRQVTITELPYLGSRMKNEIIDDSLSMPLRKELRLVVKEISWND